MKRIAIKPRSVLDDMFLRALVRDIVRGSFAASLAATAAGCPGDDLTLKPLDEGFSEPTCMDGKWDGLAAIKPSAPFDAAVWRTASAYTPGMDEALVGVPCANAGDMTACNATWDQAGKGDSSIGHEVGIQVSAREYVVVNRGDDVSTVGTRAELLDFLGPIDTPDEAVALARWDGYAMRCDDDLLAGRGEPLHGSNRRRRAAHASRGRGLQPGRRRMHRAQTRRLVLERERWRR
jgi:hypothetical protein